ncbi:MAG TPA: hypothetical protein VEA69_20465 [Tepidisphaeraceae bacterium]|nr:hypothetical protein [Tepidisphaeraceae bacterium]
MIPAGTILAALLAALLAPRAWAAPTEHRERPVLTITATDDPARPTVTATLPPDVAKALGAAEIPAATATPLLRFTRLDPETKQEGPPIVGSYRLTGTALRFTPTFALGATSRFRATLTLPGRASATADYTPAAPRELAAPTVEHIYPTADALPANLLKFYVHFSRPMRQTDRIFDQMHLLDAQGRPVHDPWRRLPQWSDDGRRLTLWIHPGRVKRGVNLREDLGPVLVPGRTYTLRLDATLEALDGRPLGRAVEKAFAATGEDHDRLNPATWKLDSPSAGTRDALTVAFPKPLDHALLHRLITVRGPGGKAVEGAVTVSHAETVWRFAPADPWPRGAHAVVVDDLMEDLAGNTPVRAFDTDLEAVPVRAPAVPVTFETR